MVKRNIAEATKVDEGCGSWRSAASRQGGSILDALTPSADSSQPPAQLACGAFNAPAADSMPVRIASHASCPPAASFRLRISPSTRWPMVAVQLQKTLHWRPHAGRIVVR